VGVPYTERTAKLKFRIGLKKSVNEAVNYLSLNDELCADDGCNAKIVEPKADFQKIDSGCFSKAGSQHVTDKSKKQLGMNFGKQTGRLII
jgi:hypothetical protein